MFSGTSIPIRTRNLQIRVMTITSKAASNLKMRQRRQQNFVVVIKYHTETSHKREQKKFVPIITYKKIIGLDLYRDLEILLVPVIVKRLTSLLVSKESLRLWWNR